jgi:hypothetical protein
METPIPVMVECHSGYRADEYPKSFYRNDKRYVIKEIADRWYQGHLNPEWPVANYYKVITTSDEQYILKHEIERDEWYLL